MKIACLQMVNKLKRVLQVSLDWKIKQLIEAEQEKKMETTMKDHNTPIRVTKIQNVDNNKCWQGCDTSGTLMHCWWECESTATLEDNFMVSHKTKHTLTIQFNTLAPWFTQSCWKLCPHKTCIQTFTAVLFITAKTWKNQDVLSRWVDGSMVVHPSHPWTIVRH